MADQQYSGECRGGPWDGQRLAHYSKIKVVHVMRKYRPTPHSGTGDPDELVQVKLGEYHHIAQQWIWRE